jgi:prepilin-type N-terminal cleavage/methylation domain-containing protein
MKSAYTTTSSAGFTLAELAIVLLIIGLLVGGALIPLGAQVELKRIGDAQKSLDDIKEALLGYAAANGRLPCPDTTGDGVEDRTAVNGLDGCQGGVYEGNLPWVTLGIGSVDSWGNRFHYRVTNEFTRTTGDPTAAGCSYTGFDNSCTLELGDTGDIAVRTRGDNPATGAVESKFVSNLATAVPAVILSFGKNGYGAVSSTGGAIPGPPVSNVDEATNANMGAIKMWHTRTIGQVGCSDTAEGQPFCEFDDLVTWLPTTVLFSRMVAAGKLP